MLPSSSGSIQMQRIPLPGAEMLEEEPLYVNAKQYHRILKCRQARAKLEAEGKILKERQVSWLLLPANKVARRYFFHRCRSFCSGGEDPNVTITHDALHLNVQAAIPDMGLWDPSPAPQTWDLPWP